MKYGGGTLEAPREKVAMAVTAAAEAERVRLELCQPDWLPGKEGEGNTRDRGPGFTGDAGKQHSRGSRFCNRFFNLKAYHCPRQGLC